MNLTNLEYFAVAAQELNFTRAARRLYISQQALSGHIAKLEERYQVALFDRGNPMTLTPAGRVLYESAKQVLDTMDVCDRKLQDIKDFKSGNLSVGIPVTRGTMMLPPLCAAFHQMYPHLHLEICESNTSAEVEQALTEGKIDLAIGYAPQDTSNLIIDPLYTEHYLLLAPKTMLKERFSPQQLEQMQGKEQSIAVFAQFPFVAQSEDTMGGSIFRQLCAEADMDPSVVLKVENILTEINLCIAGVGLCTVPSTFFSESSAICGLRDTGVFGKESRSRVTAFRLAGTTGSAPISIFRLRSKLLTQAGREFIHLAKKMFPE